MNTQPHTEYEILPHADVLYTDADNDNGLSSMDSIAKFIISMVEERSSIYRPGISEGLKNLCISKAQLGLLEKYASPKLSDKLSHFLADESLDDVVPMLDHAFWNPMVAASQKILELKGETEGEILAKQYAVVKLYAGINAAVGNMRMIMRAASGTGADPDITRTQKPPLRNEFETYTQMPAEQVLHVLKRGIMPQIAYTAHVEMGIDNKMLNKFHNAVLDVWENDPQSLSAVHMIRPIDPVEWMKYGSMRSEEFREEMIQAQADYNVKLLPPPE